VVTVDPRHEAETVARLQEWRAGRDGSAVAAALADLQAAARTGANIMPPSIARRRRG
jgi:(2R)-ethylmalonyl-CoA mutase